MLMMCMVKGMEFICYNLNMPFAVLHFIKGVLIYSITIHRILSELQTKCKYDHSVNFVALTLFCKHVMDKSCKVRTTMSIIHFSALLQTLNHYVTTT